MPERDSAGRLGVLDRLNLRQRLGLGFMTGIAAMLAVTLAAAVALDFNARQEKKLRQYNADLSVVLGFSRAASQLQLAASRYVFLGHPSAHERVEALFTEWGQLASSCANGNCPLVSQDPDFSEALTHLQTFFDTYLSVVDSRERILAALQDDFARMRVMLNAAIDASEPTDGLPSADEVALSRLYDRLSTVESQLLAFFHSMDAQRLADAEVYLEAMRADLAQLLRSRGSATRSGAATAAEQVPQVVYQNIQRIRGYAYLVNVVMASEAYEMLYLAGEAADRVVATIAAQQTSIEASRRRFVVGLFLSIAAIAALALVTIRRVTRSITAPLELLAADFRRLACGAEDPIRVRSQHDDEIGALALAAEAFRNENTQMRRLLGDYEALNSTLEAKVRERTSELQLKNDELDRIASIDSLTGVSNRRILDVALNREIALAERYAVPVGVVILDIDFFKTINDTYGHITGDRVLVRLAETVAASLRSGDVFGRWGGARNSW